MEGHTPQLMCVPISVATFYDMMIQSGLGGLLMLGFWRKAKQDAQETTESVIDDLCQLLIILTYEIGVATGCMDDEVKNAALTQHSGMIRIGFEMIRAGDHPREISDPLVSGAARLAHDAINRAILTSKFDREKMADDLRCLLLPSGQHLM
jgi:hypothetical protein